LVFQKSQFKVGDSVLVKQEKKDKLTTPFNPQPLKIKEKKGSMITATDGQNKIITRNSQRKVHSGIINLFDERIVYSPNTDSVCSKRGTIEIL
jgi:hypothetical protein